MIKSNYFIYFLVGTVLSIHFFFGGIDANILSKISIEVLFAGIIVGWFCRGVIKQGFKKHIQTKDKFQDLKSRIIILLLIGYDPLYYQISRLNKRDIIYYYLIKLWENKDDNEELDNIIEDFLSIIDGSFNREISYIDVQTPQIKEFVEKLQNNEDYREKVVRDDLEIVLKHILEFKLNKHIDVHNKQDFVTVNLSDKSETNVKNGINEANRLGLDDSVCALSRKLLEVRLVNFYINNYPNEASHFDKNKGRLKTLNQIYYQFKSDREKFEKYINSDEIESFIKSVKVVNEIGNKYVHNADFVEAYQTENKEELRMHLNASLEFINMLDEKLGD